MAGVGAVGAGGSYPAARTAAGRPLTPEQQKIVQELRQTDAEIRAHEQAHKVAAGGLGSGPTYSYTTGPDGRRYVVAGEVRIDVGPERDPEATIRKAEIVKRAALAPSDPSPQDRAVAARADALKAQAQAELQREKRDEAAGIAPADGLSVPDGATDRRGGGDGGGAGLAARAQDAYGRAAAIADGRGRSLSITA
ncbi:MAG TPA: putative metalloprotease CJM1_0395 family protein [Azospirillaceae bacterium]|nr:putative metalloprotease CJM1_0395 family protein [Azospirillaceae bacterium]